MPKILDPIPLPNVNAPFYTSPKQHEKGITNNFFVSKQGDAVCMPPLYSATMDGTIMVRNRYKWNSRASKRYTTPGRIVKRTKQQGEQSVHHPRRDGKAY